jgi:hypothetical protein
MKFPDDLQWQEAIRVADKGLKARQLGEDKTKAPRADWEKVKESVLKEALVAKFQQNRGLLQLLKETGTRPIVFESNDPYWGAGLTGKGKNRLGLLLVQVRTELREYQLPVAVGDQAPLSEADVAALEEEGEAGPAPLAPPGSYGGAGSMAAVAAPVAPVEEEGGRTMRYQAGGGLDAMPDELMPEEVQEGGGDDDDRDIILTSDQKVLLISLRKERVMSALQTLMKTVSVDCKLNFEDNNDGSFKCLDLGDNIGSFAYHPDLQKDIVETSAAFKVQGTAAGPKVAGPKVQEAGGAGSAAAVAVAAPVPLVPKGPALKKINYRGTEYRYSYKLNVATGLPFGYIFYQINDLSGEGEPVGYTGVSKKGLPSGDIFTEKPEWA